MVVLFVNTLMQNTMAEQNVPAQAPTRTDEQILPRSAWLQIGKSNLAFSASASVPAIYIQQFWNTMKYDEKTGVYCCQVDEQWVNLSADLLRKALDITPVDPAHPFELPPTGDTVIDFVNQLGLKDPKNKAVPLLIPYGRFTKMIIYYLGSTSDVHKRLESPCHLPGDDFLLDDEAQQESVPQGESDDHALELAKKMSLDAHQEKGEGEGADADIERAIKLSLDPSFLPRGRAPVGGVTIRDPVSETTPILPEVVGKGKAIVTEEQVAHSLIDLSKKKRTTDQFILVRRDQAPHDSTTGPSSQPEDDTSEKVVQESSSTTDSERTESETEAAAPKGDKEQGEVASSTVTSGVGISVRTEDQAGSDPGKAHEALAGPDPEPMQEDQTGSDSGKVHVSLAGPNPEHMDEEFLATAYPKVHENLKLITDERVIEDNPESHSGSMSSMKNLEDTDNFGDQFLYDKPTEDDQEKSKVVDESDSTIPDPSHQTFTSTPPVIAPVIDFSSPKPSSQVTPPPINTEATIHHTCIFCFYGGESLEQYDVDSGEWLRGSCCLTCIKESYSERLDCCFGRNFWRISVAGTAGVVVTIVGCGIVAIGGVMMNYEVRMICRILSREDDVFGTSKILNQLKGWLQRDPSRFSLRFERSRA
ncbi:hypothetical protein Tco_0680818 [Tanacetum coccineum]|uniref:Uncharacterized protein n=1 Tax=Tanacetum coccineum TaxID=301880 RepID=A0ABQ4XLV2_9ASTR